MILSLNGGEGRLLQPNKPARVHWWYFIRRLVAIICSQTVQSRGATYHTATSLRILDALLCMGTSECLGTRLLKVPQILMLPSPCTHSPDCPCSSCCKRRKAGGGLGARLTPSCHCYYKGLLITTECGLCIVCK